MAARQRKPRVLLAFTGSVACVKAELLVAALAAFAEVRCMATPAALRFLAPDGCAPERLHGALLATEATEWAAWRAVGDPVVHIALRRWADLLLVAPLSANSLAKLAGGLCDNLVTCVARAWDFQAGRPLLVAPAMNTAMWAHPLTARHLAVLAELGVCVVPPIAKRLACGDVGMGALAAVETLAAEVQRALERSPRWGWEAEGADDGAAAAAELDQLQSAERGPVAGAE